MYCASKAGVRLLSQSLALELAEYGIKCKQYSSRTINTEMISRCLHDRAPLYGLSYEEYLKEFNEATAEENGRAGGDRQIVRIHGV